MDLNYNSEENAFREQVREFIQNDVPQALRDKVTAHKPLSKAEM